MVSYSATCLCFLTLLIVGTSQLIEGWKPDPSANKITTWDNRIDLDVGTTWFGNFKAPNSEFINIIGNTSITKVYPSTIQDVDWAEKVVLSTHRWVKSEWKIILKQVPAGEYWCKSTPSR